VKTPDSRLLQALREARVHLPAGDLAAQLGASTATIRTQLAELRAAGFEIEDRPALGFRLIAAPDRLIADDLIARLDGCPLVRDLIVFEETGSTNELVLQRGRQGAAAGLVIFAERQTAGRGRFGRRWESASHRGLWFSLLLRPALPLARWARLTTWAAVAVAAAIERVGGRPASIKWPNDVFLDGKKVAGILIESGTDATGQPFAVVGIGVNVNHEPSDFPPELIERAASLRMATGRVCDRADLAATILTQLAARFDRLADAFPDLVGEAAARSLLLGRWVQLRSGTSLHEGLAESLDENGQLLVRAGDGSAECFTAGEVTVVGSQAMT
jgi:BirA family transcriptional regulator, biotin operon repressor / biotin---[acetyl-CoA-carboxylase] ligase